MSSNWPKPEGCLFPFVVSYFCRRRTVKHHKNYFNVFDEDTEVKLWDVYVFDQESLFSVINDNFKYFILYYC